MLFRVKRIPQTNPVDKMILHRIFSLAVVLIVLEPFIVHAEHEANHRYNVRGYVLDDAHMPISDTPVSLRMDGKVLGSARTDSEGYYSIRAHLHDFDIGRKLTVRAGDRHVEIRMQGTPGDLSTNRIHHVNFIGGEVVEAELDRSRLPGWSYALGALLVASAGVVAVRKWRRRSRRLSRRQEATAKPKRKGKRKRKRRRQ